MTSHTRADATLQRDPDSVRFLRVVVALAAIVGIIAITVDVLWGGISRSLDSAVSEFMASTVDQRTRNGLIYLNWLGEQPYSMLPLMAITLYATVRTRRLRPGIMVVLILAVLVAATQPMKMAFGRTGPETGLDMFGMGDTAYPSGHAAGAVVIWATVVRIALALWGHRIPMLRRRWGRMVIVAGICCLGGTPLVGLNYHWITDLFAGWLLGIAIAVLAPSPMSTVTQPSELPFPLSLVPADIDPVACGVVPASAVATSARMSPARAFGVNQVDLRGIFSRARLTLTKSSTDTGATMTAASATPRSTAPVNQDRP